MDAILKETALWLLPSFHTRNRLSNWQLGVRNFRSEHSHSPCNTVEFWRIYRPLFPTYRAWYVHALVHLPAMLVSVKLPLNPLISMTNSYINAFFGADKSDAELEEPEENATAPHIV